MPAIPIGTENVLLLEKFRMFADILRNMLAFGGEPGVLPGTLQGLKSKYFNIQSVRIGFLPKLRNVVGIRFHLFNCLIQQGGVIKRAVPRNANDIFRLQKLCRTAAST